MDLFFQSIKNCCMKYVFFDEKNNLLCKHESDNFITCQEFRKPYFLPLTLEKQPKFHRSCIYVQAVSKYIQI